MASINDNNIIFTSVVDSVKGVKGKIQNLNNKYSTYEEGDVIGKFVNAVEIDWNGAQLGDGNTINTTGELLSYISSKPSMSAVKDYVADYVTNQDFGSNIDINESEVELGQYVTGLSKSGDTVSVVSKSLLKDGETTKEGQYISGLSINNGSIKPTFKDLPEYNGIKSIKTQLTDLDVLHLNHGSELSVVTGSSTDENNNTTLVTTKLIWPSDDTTINKASEPVQYSKETEVITGLSQTGSTINYNYTTLPDLTGLEEKLASIITLSDKLSELEEQLEYSDKVMHCELSFDTPKEENKIIKAYDYTPASMVKDHNGLYEMSKNNNYPVYTFKCSDGAWKLNDSETAYVLSNGYALTLGKLVSYNLNDNSIKYPSYVNIGITSELTGDTLVNLSQVSSINKEYTVINSNGSGQLANQSSFAGNNTNYDIATVSELNTATQTPSLGGTNLGAYTVVNGSSTFDDNLTKNDGNELTKDDLLQNSYIYTISDVFANNNENIKFFASIPKNKKEISAVVKFTQPSYICTNIHTLSKSKDKITQNITYLSDIYTCVIKLTRDGINQYTISWNNNGDITSTKQNEGDNLILLDAGTIQLKRFDGWFTSATGGNKVTTNTIVTKDVMYYAHWTDCITVNWWNDTGVFVTTEHPLGEYLELPTTIPNKAGYTFVGWFNDELGESSLYYDPSNENAIMIPNSHEPLTIGEMNYVAHWTPNNYTVTFDVNGGDELNPTTKTVTFGSTYGDMPTPKRTGYEFTGWYTAATGGIKKETTSKVSTSKDHTLYAHWEEIVTTTYKYYIGAISEEDLIDSSVVNNLINNSTTTSKDGMTSLPIPATNKTTPYVLFIYPTIWGTPKITYKTYGTGNMSASDLDISEAPSGYKLYVWEYPAGTPYDIIWTK